MRKKAIGFFILLAITAIFLALIPIKHHNGSDYLFAVQPGTNTDVEGNSCIINSPNFDNASENAIVKHDLITGEVTIIEPESDQSLLEYLGFSNTEPIIPDGIEIAPPPVASTRGLINVTRSEITNVNSYPYCAIALLSSTFQGGPGQGSAAFIGETALLTAAHNIKHPSYGTASSIYVKPGGVNSSFSSDVVIAYYTPIQWDTSYDDDYDYAVILISNNLGTGCYGTYAESNSNLKNKAVWAYGYPYDKYGTLWYDSGNISSSLPARVFYYSADAVFGDSGGPIVLQSNYLYIVGIVTKSYNLYYNQAKRVTSDVVDMDLNYS